MRRFRQPQAPQAPLFFGVATSDHQCEAFDPRYPDTWDAWEDRTGLAQRGRGTDFWNRYPEDLALAAGLGCRAFRFGVSWSRIEPSPGRFNEEALAHYRRVAEATRDAGMIPVVTLLHWTWPLHVEERGGLLAPEFPDWFGRYAAQVAEALGECVGYWVSVNEPNALPFGFVKFPWQRSYPMPPGLGNASARAQVEGSARAIRNLFRAHTAARSEIRARFPQAKVSANPCLLGFPEWFRRWLDWRLVRAAGEEEWVRREERSTEPSLLDLSDADVVLATLSTTPEREQQVLFSEPYFRTRPALLVRADRTFSSPLDLREGRVAVVRGTSAEREIPAFLPGARSVRCRDFPAALAALDAGRADAFLGPEASLAGVIGRNPQRYRLLATHLSYRGYGAAVGRGRAELLDRVDAVIRDFKESGAWAASCARHFGGWGVGEWENGGAGAEASSRSRVLPFPQSMERPPPKPAPDGGAEKPPFPGELPAMGKFARIRRRGRLRVAVTPGVPGFCERDPETGELRGLEIDLARALAASLLGDPERLELVPVRARRRLAEVGSMLQAPGDFTRKLWRLSTVMNPDWWHLGMAGRLPAFLCPPECVGQQDYVGVDYYWGIPTLRMHQLFRLIEAMQQRFARAPVWPQGLYYALRNLGRLFPGMEVLVVENGCPEREDGLTREQYLRRHVAQVMKARRRGVNVSGYLCWSITTTPEWGLECGGACDFGLYHIDLEDPELRRQPTSSAEEYRRIIAWASGSPIQTGTSPRKPR